MKTPAILLACLLMGSSLAHAGPDPAPTLKVSGDWIVVSGFDGLTDLGKLPWTYAIRRSAILSVRIYTDYSELRPNDGSKPKNYDRASAEEIAALPREITTTELGSNGQNRQYQVSGLTHGTAPAFLGKILEAAEKLEIPVRPR